LKHKFITQQQDYLFYYFLFPCFVSSLDSEVAYKYSYHNDFLSNFFNWHPYIFLCDSVVEALIFLFSLQKYKAQVQRINETSVTSLPPISKSSGPCGRTEIAQSHKKQNFLPSRLGYESSNFGYKSLCANPNSHLSTDTNGFPYDLNKNENREALGLEGGSVQVPELELPNLKTETQNRFSLDSTGKPPADATNLEEFLADFNNESQQLEAITKQAPPNQPLIEYGDLLKVLEEDPEDLELYAFGSELNPSDVDRYCEWLREILGGNITNPE
jgi:hypothetical protein